LTGYELDSGKQFSKFGLDFCNLPRSVREMQPAVRSQDRGYIEFVPEELFYDRRVSLDPIVPSLDVISLGLRSRQQALTAAAPTQLGKITKRDMSQFVAGAF
jgi:hypothetical protein